MKNVLLVFGGKSYEHDISVVTASQVYNKTKLSEIKLILFYISRDNKYYIYDSNKFDLKDFSQLSFSAKNKKFKEVVFVSGENGKIFTKSKWGLKEYVSTDCAIFACHGGSGENGKLVSVFESIGIYSSAGNFDSLAICMNKFLFKQTMKGLKIPVVSGFKIAKSLFEKDSSIYDSRIKFLHYPVILKVNNGGSSIGVFTANNKNELLSKLQEAFELDHEVLIENYISDCREFNVAIIGTADDFEVAEVDEPIKQHEVLSFADKYLNDNNGSKKVDCSLKNSMVSSSRKYPAEISSELSNRIKQLASKIFTGLNLSGVVRIDFLFDEKNDKLFVCEVNAIPGSLSFYFFKENKILLNEFVLKLINIAKHKADEDSYFNEEFSTNILD